MVENNPRLGESGLGLEIYDQTHLGNLALKIVMVPCL